MRNKKQIVREFYDTFGWDRNADGNYKDTKTFVDMRAVLGNYYHKTHMRVKDLIKLNGQYFLDAGSGAIPYPEYLEYSSGYKQRICVDISAKALLEARSKLLEKGLYVIADLTKLPFRDGIFDATVCAHVLYHIPQDEQKSAIQELYRTLKKDGCCVIIYCWPPNLFTKFLSRFTIQNVTAKIRRTISIIPIIRHFGRKLTNSGTQIINREKSELPPIYFHAHDYKWFRETLPDDWETDIRCWRFVSKPFTKTFVGNNIIGRILLEWIFKLETIFPHALAGIGSYPMIIIRK